MIFNMKNIKIANNAIPTIARKTVNAPYNIITSFFSYIFSAQFLILFERSRRAALS